MDKVKGISTKIKNYIVNKWERVQEPEYSTLDVVAIFSIYTLINVVVTYITRW